MNDAEPNNYTFYLIEKFDANYYFICSRLNHIVILELQIQCVRYTLNRLLAIYMYYSLYLLYVYKVSLSYMRNKFDHFFF